MRKKWFDLRCWSVYFLSKKEDRGVVKLWASERRNNWNCAGKIKVLKFVVWRCIRIDGWQTGWLTYPLTVAMWFQDPTVIPLSSESHFLRRHTSVRQQCPPFPPVIFVGVYYFIFLVDQLLPQSQIASVVRSSQGTVEFYSSHVSLIIQFLVKVIQVCQDYNPLPILILLQTSFLKSAPPSWVLNNSYFLTVGGILNLTFIPIYY
jgi:hypothetical protein